MTSRERLLAAARGEACDHIPVSPFGLGRLDPEGDVAARLVKECDAFITAELGGHSWAGQNYEESRVEDGQYIITTIETPGGPLTCRTKRTDVATHLVEFPCKGPDDLYKLLSIPFEPAAPDVTQFRETKKRYGDEALVIAGLADAICMPGQLLSPEDFCILWADAPDTLVDVVEELTDRLELFVDAACRAGVDGFRVVGGELATAQLGPGGFDRLVAGPDKRLADVMHRHGALVYYHNHGPVIMPYLDALAQMGVDYLDPLEMPPYGDTDLIKAREIIDGRYCIVGTFDDMEVLQKLPADQLKEMARERVEQYGTRGYCIGGTASGTYTEQAAEGFCALAEWARDVEVV